MGMIGHAGLADISTCQHQPVDLSIGLGNSSI